MPGHPRVTAYCACSFHCASYDKRKKVQIARVVPCTNIVLIFAARIDVSIIATPDSVLLVGEMLLLYGFVTQSISLGSVAICIAILSKPTGWLLVPALSLCFTLTDTFGPASR